MGTKMHCYTGHGRDTYVSMSSSLRQAYRLEYFSNILERILSVQSVGDSNNNNNLPSCYIVTLHLHVVLRFLTVYVLYLHNTLPQIPCVHEARARNIYFCLLCRFK